MNIRIIGLAALLSLFSAELYSQGETGIQLKRHVAALTSDSLMGRMAGTPGEKSASLYINRELVNAGVESMYGEVGQTFSFLSTFGDTIHSQNVVGIIEGYDPKLRDELIVIGAHYDHLGFNMLTINGKKSTQIFRGANDNASGTAVLIEVARELRRISFDLKRSVIVVAFGAGESSLTGSWYFLDNGMNYRDKIKLMVNLDQVGKSSGGYHPMVFTVLPGAELTALIKDVSDKPAMITPEIRNSDSFSSDHRNFSTHGIPVAMFTTALKKEFPSEKDSTETLDYQGMSELTHYVTELAHTAANMEYSIPVTSLSGKKDEVVTEQAKVYTMYEVDKRPSFLSGGEKQFLDRWVYDYIKYPDSAIKEGIQGRVVVEFVIEKDGKVSSVKVVKSVDDALDAEAVKVVAASPKWKAGIKGGEPVRVKMAIPIEFKLRK